MVKWKFWQKNKQTQEDPNLPDEVQEYYQSTRRERVGVAWLLAFATVIVTLLIALLLYFGGRWVVNRFFVDDDAPTEITQQEDSDMPIPPIPEIDSDEDRDESETSEREDDERTAPTEETRPERETPSRLPADGERSPSDRTESTTPRTGPESIPDTGPGGVIAVFTAVSAVAGTAHYFVRRK